MIDTLGAYPDWSPRRSIVVMTSSPNQLIVAGRLEDQIRAAAHGCLVRELRRGSRPVARRVDGQNSGVPGISSSSGASTVGSVVGKGNGRPWSSNA
jgi:hypothetical protein